MEKDLEKKIIKAAINWWKMFRPVDWGEDMHVKNPRINMNSTSEMALGEAVAAYLIDKKGLV